MTVLSFIIGAIIGSSLGAFIYRRDDIKSFIFGRSECEMCGERIELFYNIPILSYLFLRGRCKYCGEKIDFSIFLIEVISAVLTLLTYIKYGLTLNFIIKIIQVYLIILIAFTDIRYHHIYSFDAYLVFFSEFIYKLFNNLDIIEPIIFTGLLFLIYFLIYKITSSMGFGDVIFGGVSGFFASDYFSAFVILRNSFIIAAIISIIFIISGLKDRRESIAFCPYIALALMEVIL